MQTDNPVLNALFTRRSIRRYTGEPVGADQVRTILEAGRWAPSGLNNQPWRFAAVWRGDQRQEQLAQYTKYGHIVRGAAVLVAVLLDRSAMYHEAKDHQGAGACIQNMLLAAHALGLGAVWLGEIINQQSQVLDTLGVDETGYLLEAVIALGHPDQNGASDRKPLRELLLEPLPQGAE